VTAGATIDIKRVITGEGAPAVVAGKAVVARRCAMLEDRNIGHLPSVRRTGYDVVTFVTAHALASRVISVPKDRLKVIFRLRRAIVRADLVTNCA